MKGQFVDLATALILKELFDLGTAQAVDLALIRHRGVVLALDHGDLELLVGFVREDLHGAREMLESIFACRSLFGG